MVKYTNPVQFEKMVEFMEENPELARGFLAYPGPKEEWREKWQRMAKILNILGPPTRKVVQWQKVWVDLKIKVRKHLAHHQSEYCDTEDKGSRVYPLKGLQKRVANVINSGKLQSPTLPNSVKLQSPTLPNSGRLQSPTPTADTDTDKIINSRESFSEKNLSNYSLPMMDSIEDTAIKIEKRSPEYEYETFSEYATTMPDSPQSQNEEEQEPSTECDLFIPASPSFLAASSWLREDIDVDETEETENRTKLMMEQVEYLKKIEKHMDDCSTSLRTLAQLKAEKVELYRQDLLDQRKYRRLQLKVQLDTLALKRKKLAASEVPKCF